MTTDNFIKKMDAKLALILKEDIPLRIAVGSVMSLQSKRIFVEGKKADGSLIGNYVGGEIYVSPNANPTLKNFPLKGKEGKAVKKNGDPYKTGYFQNYLAFKKVLGKNNKITSVDLMLTGKLRMDWANTSSESQPAKAKKINQHNYITEISQENLNKVERYGNVFGLTEFEHKEFIRVINYEFKKAMK